MKLTRKGIVLAAGFRHWLDLRRPEHVFHEDLSEELIIADMKTTPAIARRKGDKLKDMLFSWPLETLGPRTQ